MTVRELINQLIAYNNQDEEVKALYVLNRSGDVAYLSILNTFAADNDSEQFIAVECQES